MQIFALDISMLFKLKKLNMSSNTAVLGITNINSKVNRTWL